MPCVRAVVVMMLCVAGAWCQEWRTERFIHGRVRHAAAFDPLRNVVVVVGGSSGEWARGGGMAPGTLEWTGSDWLQRTAQPGPWRSGAAAFYDPTLQRVVVFGGSAPGALFGDTWSWDGRQWTQAVAVPAPGPRALAGVAWDAWRNEAVCFGGANGTWLADTWRWVGGGWQLVTTPSSPPALISPAMAFDPLLGVILLHGVSSVGTETWEWDGTRWTRRDIAARRRTDHRLAFSPAHGAVVLTGGNLDGGAPTADCEAWNAALSRWLPLGPMPVARSGHQMVETPTGPLLVSGSESPWLFTRPGMDLWQLAGTLWLPVLREQVPTERALAICVHDPASNTTLLAGGLRQSATTAPELGDPLRDAWLWDGVRWTALPDLPVSFQALAGCQDTVRGVPLVFGSVNQAATLLTLAGGAWRVLDQGTIPARTRCAMVFDSARGCAVLCGGAATPATHEWDGTRWWTRTPVHQPPPRDDPGLAFDPIRNRTVLFGGRYSADTWEWDGTDWSWILTTRSPAPRTLHRMVADPARQRVLLSGGWVTPTRESNELWAYDGANWTQLPQSLPRGRGGHAMIWDAARDRILVHGGTLFASLLPSLPIYQSLLDLVELVPGALQAPPEVALGSNLTLLPMGPPSGFYQLVLAQGRGYGLPVLPGPTGTALRLPVLPDALFLLTAGIGLRGFLDGTGAGSFVIAVPNDQALLHQRVFAAGVTLSLAGQATLTEEVGLVLVR